MFKAKVRKIGTSLGIVLCKGVLDKLKVQEGEQLYLTEDEGFSLKLSALDSEFEKKMRIADSIMKEDKEALSELAKR